MRPAYDGPDTLSLFDEDESPTLERMVEAYSETRTAVRQAVDPDSTRSYDVEELAVLLGQCLVPDSTPTVRVLP